VYTNVCVGPLAGVVEEKPGTFSSRVQTKSADDNIIAAM